MQGANSTVVYYKSYIAKTTTEDDDYHEPLEAATYREAYLQTLFSKYYKFVPEVYSVHNETITMQRVLKSERLEQYLLRNKGSISRSTLIAKIEVIITALAKAKILHRDVTYENILVDADENLWLLDFGNARRYQDSESAEEMKEWDRSIFVDTLNDLDRSINLRMLP